MVSTMARVAPVTRGLTSGLLAHTCTRGCDTHTSSVGAFAGSFVPRRRFRALPNLSRAALPKKLTMGFTVGLSGVVKPNRKPKAKAVDNGPSVLSLILTRRSGEPWGFSLTSGGVVDGVTDDSPAAKAVRSPGLNPSALRCGDKIVAVHSPPAGGKVPFSVSAIAAALTHLDITVERSKRASNSSNKASAAKQPSKQKESWQAFHREKLLKDLPKWKCGHKEDMHKRLAKVPQHTCADGRGAR